MNFDLILITINNVSIEKMYLFNSDICYRNHNLSCLHKFYDAKSNRNLSERCFNAQHVWYSRQTYIYRQYNIEH